MSSFVRFIFLLIIIGVALNLGIVLLANARSQKQQTLDLAAEKQKFFAVMARFNGRRRRADIAVEWQKSDATQKVVETSLVVRIYSLDEAGQRIPLPIFHVVIPGSQLSVDALLFDFQPNFTETYASLRNTKLAYFNHIYAESQPLADRYSLFHLADPPLSTRLNFDHITHYEIQFWQYVWDLVNNPTRDPAKTLIVTQTPPATHTLTTGIVYSIFMSNFDATPTITESDDGSLLYELLHEAAHPDDTTLSPPLTPAP